MRMGRRTSSLAAIGERAKMGLVCVKIKLLLTDGYRFAHIYEHLGIQYRDVEVLVPSKL